MLEHWIKWEPISGLANKYYIDSIIDTLPEGLKIIISEANDETKKVAVIFLGPVNSYTWTNESFRVRTISMLNKTYESNPYDKWTFFKVENSSYLKWLSEQANGALELQSLIHFSLIDTDSILDVISPYEPKVEFIK